MFCNFIKNEYTKKIIMDVLTTTEFLIKTPKRKLEPTAPLVKRAIRLVKVALSVMTSVDLA